MISRRMFLGYATTSLVSSFLSACSTHSDSNKDANANQFEQFGPLLNADSNGVKMPAGFQSRVIAHSNIPVIDNSEYQWHAAPDGGATFATEDGGWIYVSNSELGSGSGGVGAIRFDSGGNITDAYSILNNSTRNCAGGATPWQTWLSCEEHEQGIIWECDPYGLNAPQQKPAMGVFAHEAAAVDHDAHIVYMTEDKTDSGFYRFIPENTSNERLDLNSGQLQIATVAMDGRSVSWSDVPDPSASTMATRYQVETSSTFNGGEGIVYFDKKVSFATKGDNKIWRYDTIRDEIDVIYQAADFLFPVLTGVDNIALSREGDLLVGEDGGDLQIVALTTSGQLVPVIQLQGHNASEITGPAFSPDYSRLYFSSQRGTTGDSSDGITFEISGPFTR